MNRWAPWLQRIYEQAAAALDAGRLPHGLLFAGPEDLGKRALAEKLAMRTLCLARAPGEEACGTCRSCRLYASRSQYEHPETRPDGTLAHPDGHPAHPDAHFIGYAWRDKPSPPRMRTEIVIDQIRAMSAGLALTPQYGEHQVAIIEPADAINTNAYNALLKTLEEPLPGRYIWLVSARPARLPATVRSRLQVLEFRLPPRREAMDWLRGQGHDEARAARALDAARGHPGLAHAWLGDDRLTLREQVAADLDRLARDDGSAASIARRWSGDEPVLRLRFAAEIVAERAGAEDDRARLRRLTAWFEQANRTREWMRGPIRGDLAILELLMAWPGAAA